MENYGMQKTTSKNGAYMYGIKKFLIDIDGVLFQENEIIHGAIEALKYLGKNNYDYVLVTNITRISRKKIIQKLTDFNVNVDENMLLTAPSATIDYIKMRNQNAKCYIIASKEVEDEFLEEGISVTRKEEPVDFVIVGYDTKVNFDILNSAFRLLMNGAELIAMHEDRISVGYQKNSIGLGAFVKSLEYSTKKRAIIVGKPNKNFFELGMRKINAKKNETAMIGDSLDADIIGAKKAGLKAIMVKTGYYNKKELHESSIKPDYLIDSINDLPGLLSDPKSALNNREFR